MYSSAILCNVQVTCSFAKYHFFYCKKKLRCKTNLQHSADFDKFPTTCTGYARVHSHTDALGEIRPPDCFPSVYRGTGYHLRDCNISTGARHVNRGRTVNQVASTRCSSDQTGPVLGAVMRVSACPGDWSVNRQATVLLFLLCGIIGTNMSSYAQHVLKP